MVTSGTIVGCAVAFLAGVTATFLDIYSTLSKSLPRVPRGILVHQGVLGLSALCGLVALTAFLWTRLDGGGVIGTVIALRQTNPVLRGLAVGITVLVIIRSKLFNLQDAGFG